MNVQPARTSPIREATPAEVARRRANLQARGFGCGYGSSSGYAHGPRRYIDSDIVLRFRIH